MSVAASVRFARAGGCIVTEGGSLAAIALRSVFAANWVYAENGLCWSEDSGTAAYVRVWDLIASGARLEVAFESATAAGSVIVTRERVWSDDAPGALSPLRWTGVYVLAADRILSITRVVDADQRDALLREAVIGTWRIAAGAMRLDADGGYRYVSTASRLDGDPLDSGTYVIEGGTWRVVSDDATTLCQPGDVGVWLLYAVTPDAFEFIEVEEICLAVGGCSSGPGTRLLAARAALRHGARPDLRVARRPWLVRREHHSWRRGPVDRAGEMEGWSWHGSGSLVSHWSSSWPCTRQRSPTRRLRPSSRR